MIGHFGMENRVQSKAYAFAPGAQETGKAMRHKRMYVLQRAEQRISNTPSLEKRVCVCYRHLSRKAATPPRLPQAHFDTNEMRNSFATIPF